MRELTIDEMSFVAGGPGETQPTCPGGTTPTNVTYYSNGNLSGYSCAPISETSDALDTIADIATIAAAVIAAAALWVMLDS